MIWEFSEGIVFRTACKVTQFIAGSTESIVNLLLEEFNDVKRYETDPFLVYLSLHQKIASTLNGEEAQSSFYKSAQHRVNRWGKGILLGLKYEQVEMRIIVTKKEVPQKSDDNHVPERIAKQIADLLGGEHYAVKKINDISWYTNSEFG
jgi:hypothetical protein